MTVSTYGSIRGLVVVGLVGLCLLSSGLVAATPAVAFEVHEPIEPPFGSFSGLAGIAIDQSSGNVYADDERSGSGEVGVFGPEGEAPAGGGPPSFNGAQSFEGAFGFYGAVAVDNACYLSEVSGGACTSLDPSNGNVYISHEASVDKYRLNGANEYEYVCMFEDYENGASECLATPANQGQFLNIVRGLAVDATGDVFIGNTSGIIYEYDTAGNGLNEFELPQAGEPEVEHLAVANDGTIYAEVHYNTTATSAVLEIRRNSLTGVAEGEPVTVADTAGATGVAFDQKTGQLFVDLGSSGEVLNGAHEIISTFGDAVISDGGAIAVNETTEQVYVANQRTNQIDRFGPGVVAVAPSVDASAPSVSDLTRTSALLSATVDTGDDATTYELEYVQASEYQPGAANPYSNGGSTQRFKLAPSASGGVVVGPLPFVGLTAGTTYHYRVVASNEIGTTYGPDYTFTTSPPTPPVVSTGSPSEVTQTSATLSGMVGPQGLQTSYEFEVGTDTTYAGAKLFGNAGQSAGAETVSVGLRYLVPGVTYHYRIVATNEDGASYGQDMTFTTPGVPDPISQPPTPPLLATPQVTFPAETVVPVVKKKATKKSKKRLKNNKRNGTRNKKKGHEKRK